MELESEIQEKASKLPEASEQDMEDIDAQAELAPPKRI